MQPNVLPRLTEEEYLALDRAAEYKNEFVGGEMFAMSGGKLRHSDIGVSVVLELAVKLRPRGCRVFNSDARIRTPKSRSYLYPDATVVCGPVERDQDDILLNPVVIVEVLSPSTADYDHGKKFAMYREIASFRDYLMVHTDSFWVEHYTKGDNGIWQFKEYEGMDGEITLASVGCTISMKSIYDGVVE